MVEMCVLAVLRGKSTNDSNRDSVYVISVLRLVGLVVVDVQRHIHLLCRYQLQAVVKL